MEDNDYDGYDENEVESLQATAQVLNALLSRAVRLVSEKANISEPEAWRLVMDSFTSETKDD
jgi:hypothetical protein